MNRFFIEPEDINEEEGTAVIRGEPVKHIGRVLRMGKGDSLVLADGRGFSYLGTIAKVDKDAVQVDIIEKLSRNAEPPIQVILAQALAKGEKMDLVVQKSTELGVQEIIPFICRRSVVKVSPENAQRKVQRWQKIAKGAAEQSHRDRIPNIKEIASLDNLLSQAQDVDLLLFLWEQEKQMGIKEVLKAQGEVHRVMLLVGPEGGFTEEEAELAKSRGAIPVSLGPRILRTETAACAAVTMVLYELGDLGEADE
ncbi:MAG: 16S rRNA (uracil(1498)-N(3))-methyltransferase [Candidatus Contubernalis sp.]|nr:16S rRNA (uracil(1498)-N(3))-methyltransferase [Candidatus Contubernalis sp.]